MNTQLMYNITLITFGVIIGLAFVLLILALFKKRSKNDNYYKDKWREIQKMLSNKNNWDSAVLAADCLLDECLKKHHFKGKSMGERLVSAQREINNNELVWFSHKLKNSIMNDGIHANKTETKKSLLGIWSALKDLGAFNS